MEERRMRDLHAQQVGAIADERRASEGRLREQIAELNAKFEATFRSLAAEALKSSREDFFALAKKTFDAHSERATAEVEKRKAAVDELIRPIGETLKKTDQTLAEIETERTAGRGTRGAAAVLCGLRAGDDAGRGRAGDEAGHGGAAAERPGGGRGCQVQHLGVPGRDRGDRRR